MKLSRLNAFNGFLLAAVLTAPAWAADTALPGTLNYIEGQATVGDQALTTKSVGSVGLQPGESLRTDTGKAEILLTPGVFLRVGDNSTVKIVSSNLTNTEADLTKGQSTVEVAEIHEYNDLRIVENGVTTRVLKDGLYSFDADHNQVLVYKGEALVQDGDQNIKVKDGHELDLNQTGRLQTRKFNKNSYESSDLYRFSALRSQYLAEANVDVARKYYAGGPGFYGAGWYWDPFFTAYTFIPGDGIFYSPFGYGFYSPFFVGYAPYYGFYGYRGGYGLYPGYYRGRVVRGANGPVYQGRAVASAPAARASFGASGSGFHGGGGFHR